MDDTPKVNRNFERIFAAASLLLQVAALGISLSCLIYVAVVITDINRGNNEQPTGPEGTYLNVCINCLHLDPYSLSVQNIQVLTKRKVDGVFQCCAESPQQLSAMLNVIADGRNEVPVSSFSRNPKSSPVSAHMQVSSDKVTDNEGTFDDKYKSVFTFNPVDNIKWREHAIGVAVLDKGLVILKTGTYFIYCSVSYNQSRPIQPDEKWFSYVHRIRPTSVNSTDVLLKSVHTGCVDCNQDFKTMYTAGVFYLKIGDFIQVFLSEKVQVASAFIGLALIGVNEQRNKT